MIKCNRCGMMTTAGAVYCQSCGEALQSNVDYDAAPKLAAQAQPELPAWLESLRAGERSTPPAQNVAGFSAADFVEEGSLPSWMRSERNEARDNTSGNLSAPIRPGSNPEEGSFSPSSINAQSLIDEQSLPLWMQGGGISSASSDGGQRGASSAPGQAHQDNLPAWMKTLQQSPAAGKKSAAFEPSANAAEPAAPGFSARDLIDPQALPSWMSPQGNQQPASSLSNASAQPGVPGSGFSARDLIDPQALPSWMSQQGGRPAEKPTTAAAQSTWMSSQGNQQPASSPSNASAQPGVPGSGFSARDLIDPQALPSWMSQQGNQQPGPAFNPSAQAGAPAQRRPTAPGNSFPASSLLDMDALPPWLREGGSEPKNISSTSGSWAQPAQPSQSWQMPSQAQPSWPTPGQPNPAQGQNVAASSFIDTNAVPDWLRAANGDPRTAGGPSPQGPRQGGYPVPPRVENMRVPSRPRSELGAHESSEEAANVFASMLGVAPAAPNYPAPPSSQQYQQSGFMGNQPGQSGQGGMPNAPAGQPATGHTDFGSTSGIYNGYAGTGPGQGYQMNTPQSGAQQAPGNMAGTPYGATGRADEQKNDAKTGKRRSFFDLIREWFER